METFLQDVRYGIRMLLKAPGFPVIAVLTLALGIGANAAIFSIVYGTLLQPLPYPHADQLVMVWSKVKGERNVASVGDFLEWRRQSSAFQQMYAWTGNGFNVASPGARVEQVSGSLASPGWWTKVLGEPMFLGRDFLPEEAQAGKDHVVVLAHKFWVRRFGADRDIIGRPIRLNGESYTVVGVLPAGIEDRGDAELVVPLAFKPEQFSDYKQHFLFVMGRLRPGVSIAQAQANMNIVQQHLAAAQWRRRLAGDVGLRKWRRLVLLVLSDLAKGAQSKGVAPAVLACGKWRRRLAGGFAAARRLSRSRRSSRLRLSVFRRGGS